MKTIERTFGKMLEAVPENVRREVDLSFAIANRIDFLIKQRGLTKKQFAEALGKRPSEVSKWLGGHHNFTLRTIALISAFFNESIVDVCGDE
ncbi:MAG: helix-turn-helix transcriptional regulator [Bacteroidales bacterium]|nr:helix-turn-helix transcriptional regulator [Bacteroidales bacterium]